MSCVGVIGTDDAKMRAGNGDYNVVVVEAAKAAGVRRFVYVSVASIVPDVVGGVAMKGYFEGKTMAEDAIRANFDANEYVIVKPSFIYGGDAFSLTPPRVTQASATRWPRCSVPGRQGVGRQGAGTDRAHARGAGERGRRRWGVRRRRVGDD